MSSYNAHSTTEEKVQWLLRHRFFLVGKLNIKKCVSAMKHDGLISKLTYWPDVSTGVKEAVAKAKLRWYAEHNGREITL